MPRREDARGVRGRVSWLLWCRHRLPWLLASFVCVLAAALVSLLLPLRSNPWPPTGGFASSDFWLAPIEYNGFRRLPATAISLHSVAPLADGKTALAVGDGTILRSSDAGATWTLIKSGTNAASVAVLADGKSALAVGLNGFDDTILRSTDTGATWTLVTWGTNANSEVGRAALGRQRADRRTRRHHPA